ncbi:MAG: glycosyltransferase [Flavobacterium sp.]|nr:glycosyltransferase [Flavobacterium sp.]
MSNTSIAILISTKNRKSDLAITLQKIKKVCNRNDVVCVVFDDGSTDGTYEFVQHHFPKVIVHRNQVSKGYLYCRNKMLNETTADYAISLDDDAHFLTENPIEIIEHYFDQNSKCGVIAGRIFWDIVEIENKFSNDKPQVVKGFVGCGHVWRMSAWRDIPNYPEWFQFYGEESFASIQLLKQDWEIHYVPELLVQHRVNRIERVKSKKNVAFRYRRSIRADWFNYFLFFPYIEIPRKMAYSIWMQFKNKIFKGNLKIIRPLFLAIIDLILAMPKLMKHRNSLSSEEYEKYLKLNEAKIYWKPEN